MGKNKRKWWNETVLKDGVVSGDVAGDVNVKPVEKKVVRVWDTLTLSELAYKKLKWMLGKIGQRGEMSAFGVTREGEPLYVEDWVIVKQEVSSCHTEMDDDSLSDMIVQMAGKGIEPVRCGRVWLHTHPDGVHSPSGTDELQFKELFDQMSHGVMVIAAGDNWWYARMSVRSSEGIRAEKVLSIVVDWAGVANEAWDREYEEKVLIYVPKPPEVKKNVAQVGRDGERWLKGFESKGMSAKEIVDRQWNAANDSYGYGYGSGSYAGFDAAYNDRDEEDEVEMIGDGIEMMLDQIQSPNVLNGVLVRLQKLVDDEFQVKGIVNEN
jgi:proteasome lid subunit RPN8/RPN11